MREEYNEIQMADEFRSNSGIMYLVPPQARDRFGGITKLRPGQRPGVAPSSSQQKIA